MSHFGPIVSNLGVNPDIPGCLVATCRHVYRCHVAAILFAAYLPPRPWSISCHCLVFNNSLFYLSKTNKADQYPPPGMVGLAPKWVRLDPKLDKSGAFSDQISVHLAPRAKCTEIGSEKAPDLSNLGSNLTHFGAKPSIRGQMLSILCNTMLVRDGQLRVPASRLPCSLSYLSKHYLPILCFSKPKYLFLLITFIICTPLRMYILLQILRFSPLNLRDFMGFYFLFLLNVIIWGLTKLFSYYQLY